jgi:hypothetical protein
MPEAKSDHSVCVLGGLIYAIGGESDYLGSVCSSVHRFDPVVNLWSAVAALTIAKTGLGSFVLGGSIHAVGGYDMSEMLSSMERYYVTSDTSPQTAGPRWAVGRWERQDMCLGSSRCVGPLVPIFP